MILYADAPQSLREVRNSLWEEKDRTPHPGSTECKETGSWRTGTTEEDKMWEDLTRHAEVISDLTLIAAAIIGIAMGSWRLWLADKKDRREEEERTEQRECWKHEKRQHWQERFAEAVRQVYDETDSGTLSEARRIHAGPDR